MRFSRVLAVGAVGVVLLVSGCSGGDGKKVATLGAGTSDATDSSSSSTSKQSFEDALVAYTKCMRDHGVDMPDPTFSSDGDGGQGGFAIVGGPVPDGADGGATRGATGGGGLGPNDEAFKAADEACKPILDEATKDLPKPSPEELAKQRDQALAFAKCMRDHGIDMPDPTFGDNGSVTMAAPPGGPTPGDKTVNGPDQAFLDAAKACQTDGGPGAGPIFSVNGSGADTAEAG